MRCNTGVDPAVLTDQHLIAEYRELLIPAGQLRRLGWKSAAAIPQKMSLGTGHVTFWRDKQLYLKRRHDALVEEMLSRGFKPNLSFWPRESIPAELWNDWQPSAEDSRILRERIFDRVSLKPAWYRLRSSTLPANYEALLFNSDLKY